MLSASTLPASVPSGTRLVHIGPPKTGTSTIQAQFHQAREACREQGVLYAGHTPHSQLAVHAAIGRPFLGGRVPPARGWKALRREILTTPADRVLLSSEALAYATPDAVERVVAELGGDRVRVVVSLRPLRAILPSQWLQNIQSGTVASYRGWLEVLFGQPDSVLATTVWRVHRHDELIARWAAVVGVDRVTVIVVDDADRTALPRAFEALLGLRPGTLPEAVSANRSLTLDEAEILRAFNLTLRSRGIQGDAGAIAARLHGTQVVKLHAPSPDERRLVTPASLAERMQAIQDDIVAGIAASGVPVVGDLAALAGSPEAAAPGDDAPAALVPVSVAGSMALDLLIGAGVVRLPAGEPSSSTPAGFAVGGDLPAWPTTTLARVLLRRLGRPLARRLRT